MRRGLNCKHKFTLISNEIAQIKNKSGLRVVFVFNLNNIPSFDIILNILQYQRNLMKYQCNQ